MKKIEKQRRTTNIELDQEDADNLNEVFDLVEHHKGLLETIIGRVGKVFGNNKRINKLIAESIEDDL